MHLGLKRPKSDLASIAQDSAQPVADLNSVDLQRPPTHIRYPRSTAQGSTYEGPVCGQIVDHYGRVWVGPVPPDDAMFVT